MTDPRPDAAPAEDEALRKALIKAVCPHLRNERACLGCPPKVETTYGSGTQQCRLQTERLVDAILPLIHAREADKARQLAEAHEESARLKGERDAALKQIGGGHG